MVMGMDLYKVPQMSIYKSKVVLKIRNKKHLKVMLLMQTIVMMKMTPYRLLKMRTATMLIKTVMGKISITSQVNFSTDWYWIPMSAITRSTG